MLEQEMASIIKYVLDRAGGPLGNKGAEAAEAAIKMIAFKRLVEAL